MFGPSRENGAGSSGSFALALGLQAETSMTLQMRTGRDRRMKLPRRPLGALMTGYDLGAVQRDRRRPCIRIFQNRTWCWPSGSCSIRHGHLSARSQTRGRSATWLRPIPGALAGLAAPRYAIGRAYPGRCRHLLSARYSPLLPVARRGSARRALSIDALVKHGRGGNGYTSTSLVCRQFQPGFFGSATALRVERSTRSPSPDQLASYEAARRATWCGDSAVR